MWREFPTGPAGVFLKKGRDVTDWGFMRRPPFVWTTSVPDPDPLALYYGKSFIYSAFAAPFVRVFGTNGFLLFHAVLLALVAWCSYVFLLARMPASLAATLTGAFLMASVVPVYFVWITPELFIFALGLLGVLLLALQAGRHARAGAVGHALAVRHDERRRGRHPARAGHVLEGRPTLLLFPPIVAWQLWRREWRQRDPEHGGVQRRQRRALRHQHGDLGRVELPGRRGPQRLRHEFPLQTAGSGFGVGVEKETNEALTDIIFDRRVFCTNLAHNLGYFFVGRYSGLLPYFFPALFALVAFVVGVAAAAGVAVLRRRRGAGTDADVRRLARPIRSMAAADRSATAIS